MTTVEVTERPPPSTGLQDVLGGRCQPELSPSGATRWSLERLPVDDSCTRDVPGGVFAEGLCKRFGSFTAVDDLGLVVPAGTVGTVLGPNGAGKTTTIRMLTTLLSLDGGRATVAGYDVVQE